MGVALKSLSGIPTYGVRHPPAKGTNGWYIWAGKWSGADDFFQPICVEFAGAAKRHLLGKSHSNCIFNSESPRMEIFKHSVTRKSARTVALSSLRHRCTYGR